MPKVLVYDTNGIGTKKGSAQTWIGLRRVCQRVLKTSTGVSLHGNLPNGLMVSGDFTSYDLNQLFTKYYGEGFRKG